LCQELQTVERGRLPEKAIAYQLAALKKEYKIKHSKNTKICNDYLKQH